MQLLDEVQMAYNDFTLESVRDRFELKISIAEFCYALPPVAPTSAFTTIFEEWFPVARIARSEKAKSELLISPILMEVRTLTNHSIEFFSGEEFNVDRERGLNGFCDFLLGRSSNPLIIEAPVVMLVEAKKGELDLGLGQCMAEMVAAQIFNERKGQTIPIVYGSVTSGKLWQFLKLEKQNVTLDPNEYQVHPVERILGILKWMVEN
jgi:hypothetical protein